MTGTNSSGHALVTAAVLVIGDEILSGRTKDKNNGYIADYLTALGIDLKEVRVVGDIEGEIGTPLGEIAKANPEVSIGSYPFFDEQRGPNTNVVLRARDAGKLATAKGAVEAMLSRVRVAQ